jgi:hypothetical protein
MDFALTPTTGLAPGNVIQFAVGSWPGEIGEGLALSEDSFAFVEPHLAGAWPEWTSDRRYGVSTLPVAARVALVELLRGEAARSNTGGAGSPGALLEGLADWLAERLGDQQAVSILGI